jgi:metallophosphoesterase superfamily enzyme
MWGRETIESRIRELLDDYQPETLIFNGDIVDGASSGCSEVIAWLNSLRERCANLILIEGNHDRGELVRSLKFVSRFEIGDFVFHHGHMPIKPLKPGQIEVVGHIHPSICFNDGAGLSMKLPGFIQEQKRWILPAFSPWAGGVSYQGEEGTTSWACSQGRIFQSAG